MSERKYMPSFAELIDRLNIIQMKSVFAKEGKEKFHEEISDILHDIQLYLGEGVVVTAKIIRAIVVLTQVNLEVWQNENFIRENEDVLTDSDTAKKLTYTHRLNGTRSIAKTIIQGLIGGRTDPKINCLAEGSAWDIKW